MATGPNITPAISTDGLLGGINQVFTVSTSDGYDNPPFTPGTIKLGSDGSEWLYVKAATTINQGDCVSIDGASNASQMTNALATAALTTVGFCQVSGGIPSGSYGWVAVNGNSLAINVAASSAAAVALYTTAVAGVLSSTSTSQVQIYGVKQLVANGGSQAAVAAIAIAPRITN